MIFISEIKRVRCYKQKSKILQNVFIYKNPRHFVKSKTISVTFVCTNSQALCITQCFMRILKLAFVYLKHNTLRYVTFLYTNSQTLEKIKTICVMFIYI